MLQPIAPSWGFGVFVPTFGREAVQRLNITNEGRSFEDFFILLPNQCSLRATTEGGDSSVAQFEEAIKAIKESAVDYEIPNN